MASVHVGEAAPYGGVGVHEAQDMIPCWDWGGQQEGGQYYIWQLTMGCYNVVVAPPGVSWGSDAEGSVDGGHHDGKVAGQDAKAKQRNWVGGREVD